MYDSRTCAVCWEAFSTLELLKQHVEQLHIKVEFTEEIRNRYVHEATMSHCGPAQPRCWMEEQDQYIPELGRVFGKSSEYAWFGGYQVWDETTTAAPV